MTKVASQFESWHVAFLIDELGEHFERVVIQKPCCYVEVVGRLAAESRRDSGFCLWPSTYCCLFNMVDRENVAADAGLNALYEAGNYEWHYPKQQIETPVRDLPSLNGRGWPTQADTARALKLERHQVKYLIDQGDLRTNGKAGRECRVDPASIGKYMAVRRQQIESRKALVNGRRTLVD